MTGTSTLSLIAMFGADLVDMFSLTLLSELELSAALGLAGALPCTSVRGGLILCNILGAATGKPIHLSRPTSFSRT